LAFAPDHTTTSAGQIDSALQTAEHTWRQEGNMAKLGEVLALRSLLTMRQGGIAEAAGLARQALAWLPGEERLARSMSLGIVGVEDIQAGSLDAARQTLQQARSLLEAADNRPGIRVMSLLLGDVCRGKGELRQALQVFRRVLGEAANDLADRQMALAGLSHLSYEWNDLAAAEQEVRQALDLSLHLADEPAQIHTALILARVQSARGEIAPAQGTLHGLLARTALLRASLLPLHRAVLAGQARLHLSLGDLASVQRWATTRAQDAAALPLAQREQEELLVARLLIAQGDAHEAMRLLSGLQAAALTAGRTHSVREITMLNSMAYHTRGQTAEAVQLLREVLAATQAEGYVRFYLDEGKAMAALLRTAMPQVRATPQFSYLQDLLRAFDQSGHSAPAPPAYSPLVEPLSPQERRVLRLLAAGLSRQEIARELVVSVNTVKTHLQRLYQKLNVTNRVEARHVARDHHLI
jgi:LuxR family maltose regulon positive regulatory protein